MVYDPHFTLEHLSKDANYQLTYIKDEGDVDRIV
jgi:hypothetical protein